MSSTPLGFRFRFWIILAIYVLGFTAPWDFALHLDGQGPNTHLWARLAVLLYQDAGVAIGAAFRLVLVAGIVLAAVGAWLRTWGTAYLSTDVMSDAQMRGDAVLADGPYRYVRNPLYLGGWANALALALLMPVSGAIFAVVLLVAFQVHLILAEEAFLRAKLGEPYAAYCAAVPRLWPALRPRIAASGVRPQWLRAALAEVVMWGTLVTYAIFGWQYNALLLLRGVLVSLGVSLIVRALRQDAKA